MEDEEEMSMKPNVEEIESSTTTKALHTDDVAPEVDDSLLVEPDTVVTQPVAEIVGERTAVVSVNAEVKMESEVEEVGGMESFELNPEEVGERETDTTEMVAEGQEGVVEGTVEGVLEDFEAATESIIGVKEEINIVEMAKEKEVETEMEREVEVAMGGDEGFVTELEPKAQGGVYEFVSVVEAKEEKGKEGEVMEEGVTVEPKMESEIVDRGEPGVGSMTIDAANDKNEATEEENDEIKATQHVVEDEVKVMEEVEKDETEAADEVEKDETQYVLEDEVKVMEEVEKDETKATDEVEKDETQYVLEDEVKVMEEVEKDGTEAIDEVERNETEAMDAVEKDKAVAMEEVEEDESGPMEEVEKDYGERESTGGEDESEIVGVEKDGKDESIAAEDDEEATPTEEDVLKVEVETPDSVKNTGGKRKRGKNLKVSTKTRATRKTIEEEDVCFICFDGGDLVLCDRRGCPKAYHPSCVNRDEAFFQAKGRWNCGWHLCSLCQKDAYVMCYTCTFSCCKSCLKDAGMLCVKKTRGFCETCMKTVMLIEKNEMGNKEESVDFDDKTSWEYLFKDYWIGLKERLSLSLNDLIQDKSPRKGSELTDKQESPHEQFDEKDNAGSSSDNSTENFEASKKKRRKAKKKVKSVLKKVAVDVEGNSKPYNIEWATEELIEFVMHMKNGDRSVVSQYDVQSLLLDYIQINNLRDPKRKSQIICDTRLENLFGKRRVGHFEMLKLLESHFLIKEDAQIDDGQGTVVDNTETNRMDDDETPESQSKGSKGRKRKARKKGDGRGPQYNREEYAAIDIHNISLIYLRRKLVEDLLEDTEKFEDKVVGTFVRIRIVGTNQKQDLYRLVQVVGTSKAAEPYKVGKRTADIMLEILNLNKAEIISIDTISNQEFTEDECKRLRQSIKCGLINRLTVGDILDKAMEVQAARVNDWLETEILRLSHLRDRASDMGHRKELRESVEKLQVLKTPEERMRRLEEVPTINADQKMDPSYESEDDSDKEEKKQEIYTRHRGGSSFNRRGSDPVCPRSGDFYSKDSWSGTVKNLSKNYEVTRSLSNKGFSTSASPSYDTRNENSWNQGSDKINHQPKNIEKASSVTDNESQPSNLSPPPEPDISINEADKMWNYKDPAGKIQGPFSLVQLRKWSNNGYFPSDLKTWRVTDKEDDGILLTDALAGNFASLKQRRDSHGSGQQNTPLVQVPKLSIDGRNDSMNFPSPTPQQSTPGWARGEAAPYRSSSSFPIGDGGLQSPTPDSTLQTRSSTPSSIGASGTPMPTSHDSSNSHSTFVGSTNMLQNSQSGHLVPTLDNNLMAAHMGQGQPISGQNAIVGAQGWGGTPTQNSQSNLSMNVGGHMVGYNQWTGVQSMVQNPTGILPQQPDPWGQAQVPSNQPNMQPQPVPNVNWGAMQGNPNMGWVGPTPGNPNINWGPMIPGPGNVNPTTWVMPPGGQVQVQGPMPGNMNGGWVAAPVGPTPGVNVQGMPSNQGWVGAPPPSSNSGAQMQQGIPPNNQGWVATPGWGTQTGNQVALAQAQAPAPGNVNQGWGAQTGNQGEGPAPGNPNQGWGPPAAAGGIQGWSNEKQQNGDGFSGQRGNNRGPQSGDRGGRPYNRDNRGSRDRNRDRDGDRRSSYGSRGGGSRDDSKSNEPIVCPYFPKGRCNMGTNCRFLHT